MSDSESDAPVPWVDSAEVYEKDADEHRVPARRSVAAISNDDMPVVHADEDALSLDLPAQHQAAYSGITGLPSVYTRRVDDLEKLNDKVSFPLS